MNIKPEIEDFLRELGLHKAEIGVYLACLETGSGEASRIARVSGLNRITTYEALKRLSKKGFVRIRAKKGSSVKYFTPIEYEELVEKLKMKREEFENSIKTAEKLKKEFQAQFAPVKEKPLVLFYEGVEGIKEVLNDSLKQQPEEIISFASAESLESGFDPKFLQNYWQKRVSLDIPSRGILPKTKKAQESFSNDRNKKELRNLKLISPDIYKFKNEIDIYGNNIGITSHEKGNEHGVVIRSKSLADSMRAIFETLWNLS